MKPGVLLRGRVFWPFPLGAADDGLNVAGGHELGGGLRGGGAALDGLATIEVVLPAREGDAARGCNDLEAAHLVVHAQNEFAVVVLSWAVSELEPLEAIILVQLNLATGRRTHDLETAALIILGAPLRHGSKIVLALREGRGPAFVVAMLVQNGLALRWRRQHLEAAHCIVLGPALHQRARRVLSWAVARLPAVEIAAPEELDPAVRVPKNLEGTNGVVLRASTRHRLGVVAASLERHCPASEVAMLVDDGFA
mmetsp:Transcript_103177/g.330793  ORF Transcript_103177/g.330793 Transcript_103177/m.330793 type:complete len:253 (+) Transcript_103177:3410-4168(+)